MAAVNTDTPHDEACARCGRRESVEHDYGQPLCSACFFLAMAEHDRAQWPDDEEYR